MINAPKVFIKTSDNLNIGDFMNKFITYLSLGLNLGMLMFMSQNFQIKAKTNVSVQASPIAVTQPQFEAIDIKKVNVQAQIVFYRAKQAVDLLKIENQVKNVFLKVEASTIQQSMLVNCNIDSDGASMLIQVDPKTAQDINNRESEKIIMKSVFQCLTKKREII